jgi:hypothetical protein
VPDRQQSKQAMVTPAEVVIAGTAVTYTQTGGNSVTFGLTQATVVFVYSRRRNQDQFDFTKQDMWGNPAPPATGQPDFLPATGNTVWFVRIQREECDFMDIPMGNITNQVSWTNDQTGAIACHDDIIAALPV